MADVISVINPATEEWVKEIPVDDADAVARKVAVARAAQPGWAARSLSERIEPLKRFSALLTARVESLAMILTTETGKPISQAKSEILTAPSRIDYFIDQVGEVLAAETMYQEPVDATPETVQLEEILGYDPLGVIANISAWNYPYFVGVNVFVPALLTGNAVLYKPSEVATMTGLAIAALLHEAGVPEDVFVPVVGMGLTGAALVEQAIDGVFFTGSYETGKKIAIAAAPKLIKVQLELGGKDPAYVCEDADIEKAAAGLADGAFYNNGQSCCAVERIYVHTDVYTVFLAAFLKAVEGFPLGDPTDPDTYFGPVSRQPQLAVLQVQIDDAVEKGAVVHLRTHEVDREGWYFVPTVLTKVTHEMLVMQEETFGPVIGIHRVSNDKEAITLMNDTDYGLTAAVYCAQRERAMEILSQVSSGSAYWNCCDRVSPRLPWTGRHHSGIGSTLSQIGISAFLQPRGWHLKR